MKIRQALKSKWGWWTAIVLTGLNFLIASGANLLSSLNNNSEINNALFLGVAVITVPFLIIKFVTSFIFGLGLEKLFRG